MVVKYCPKCEGKPYTKDFNVTVCSTYDSALLLGKSSEDDSNGLLLKMPDAIMYEKGLKNALHSFTVRINNGKDSLGNQLYADIPVNICKIMAGGM